MERTENVFWLKVIREALKSSQKEIVDDDWGGKELSVGN